MVTPEWGAPASEVSACALSRSSDFASGKKCEGGVLQIQKKPRRNTYRGFFPMSMRPGPAMTQATENTTTQEDAYKVAKARRAEPQPGCPLLALSRHGRGPSVCPLSEVNRTYPTRPLMSVRDP